MAFRHIILVAFVIVAFAFIALAVLPSIKIGDIFQQKYTVTGTIALDQDILQPTPTIRLDEILIQKQSLPFSIASQFQSFSIWTSGERTQICIDYSAINPQCVESGKWGAGIGAPYAEWRKPFTFGNLLAGNHTLTVILYNQAAAVKSQTFNIAVGG